MSKTVFLRNFCILNYPCTTLESFPFSLCTYLKFIIVHVWGNIANLKKLIMIKL